MTHDAATIAAINKRIAEFEGWLDIFENTQGTLDGTPPSCVHRTEGGGLVIQDFVAAIPDYWHSADAVIPVVERLCRERDAIFTLWSDGTKHDVQIDGLRFNAKKAHPTLPAAACLAVVAVLDSNHPTPGGSDA